MTPFGLAIGAEAACVCWVLRYFGAGSELDLVELKVPQLVLRTPDSGSELDLVELKVGCSNEIEQVHVALNWTLWN